MDGIEKCPARDEGCERPYKENDLNGEGRW
jgi:hypothetical protein